MRRARLAAAVAPGAPYDRTESEIICPVIKVTE